MEENLLECIADELIKIKEQIENLNELKFEKLLVVISEANRHLKKIADNLEIQANN